MVALGAAGLAITAAACSSSDTSAETTVANTTTGELTTVTTPTPATAEGTTATTQPASTEPTDTQPNITTPRTKKEVRREVLAVIDQMNIAVENCLQQQSDCNPASVISQYASLSTPIGAQLVYNLDEWAAQGVRPVDIGVIVRIAESVAVADDLNSAVVVTCEIDPVVMVKDTAEGVEIVDDDVYLYRNTVELVRLSNGRWMIGPSDSKNLDNAADIPLCDEAFRAGSPSARLAPNSDISPPDDYPTSGDEDTVSPQSKDIKRTVLNRQSSMRDAFDRCLEDPTRCQPDQIVKRFSLDDTAIAWWYPEIAKDWADREIGYEDASQITRTIDEITVDRSGVLATIAECHYDDATVTELGNATASLEREPQKILFNYVWADLADRGWMVLSATQTELPTAEGAESCDR